eukprot:gene2658-3066_t
MTRCIEADVLLPLGDDPILSYNIRPSSITNQGCVSVTFNFVTTSAVGSINSISPTTIFSRTTLLPKNTDTTTGQHLFNEILVSKLPFGISYLSFSYTDLSIQYSFNQTVFCDPIYLADVQVVQSDDSILTTGVYMPKLVYFKLSSPTPYSFNQSAAGLQPPIYATCNNIDGTTIINNIQSTPNSLTNGEFAIQLRPNGMFTSPSQTHIKCNITNYVGQSVMLNIPVRRTNGNLGTLDIDRMYPANNSVTDIPIYDDFNRLTMLVVSSNLGSQAFVTSQQVPYNMPNVPLQGNIANGAYLYTLKSSMDGTRETTTILLDSNTYRVNWEVKKNTGSPVYIGENPSAKYTGIAPNIELTLTVPVKHYIDNLRITEASIPYPVLLGATGMRDNYALSTNFYTPFFIPEQLSPLYINCPFQNFQVPVISQFSPNPPTDKDAPLIFSSTFTAVNTNQAVWKLRIVDQGSGFLMIKGATNILITEADLQEGDVKDGVYEKLVSIREIRTYNRIFIYDRKIQGPFDNVFSFKLKESLSIPTLKPSIRFDIKYRDPIISTGAWNSSTLQFEIPFTLPRNMVQQALNFTLLTPLEIYSQFLPTPYLEIITPKLGWRLDIVENGGNGFDRGYGYVTDASLIPIPFNLTTTEPIGERPITFTLSIPSRENCIPQVYTLSYLVLQDSQGYRSETSYPSDPTQGSKFDPFSLVDDPWNTFKSINVTCPTQYMADTTPPTISTAGVTVMSVDVGVETRTFTVVFTATDIESGIDQSVMPFVYATTFSYQVHESPCIIQGNATKTKVSYECLVDLPYGFGTGAKIYFHAYGIANRDGLVSGSQLSISNTPLSVTRNYYFYPIILGNEPVSTNGGRLILYGSKFTNVGSVTVTLENGTQWQNTLKFAVVSGVNMVVDIKPVDGPFKISVNAPSAYSNIYTIIPTRPNVVVPTDPPITEPPVSCPAPPEFDPETPTTNSSDPDQKYQALISVVSVREMDSTGTVVNDYPLKLWYVYTQNDSQSGSQMYVYNTTYANGQSSITVRIQYFENATTIQYAGEEISVFQSSVKYTIELSHYTFANAINTIQVLMGASMESREEDTCDTSEVGNDINGKLQWIKLRSNDKSLYGVFLQKAIVDQRPMVITNTLLDGGFRSLDTTASSSTSYVAINVPYFTNTVLVDPTFNLLIDPKPASCPSKGLTKNQIIGISVACALRTTYKMKKYNCQQVQDTFGASQGGQDQNSVQANIVYKGLVSRCRLPGKDVIVLSDTSVGINHFFYLVRPYPINYDLIDNSYLRILEMSLGDGRANLIDIANNTQVVGNFLDTTNDVDPGPTAMAEFLGIDIKTLVNIAAVVFEFNGTLMESSWSDEYLHRLWLGLSSPPPTLPPAGPPSRSISRLLSDHLIKSRVLSSLKKKSSMAGKRLVNTFLSIVDTAIFSFEALTSRLIDNHLFVLVSLSGLDNFTTNNTALDLDLSLPSGNEIPISKLHNIKAIFLPDSTLSDTDDYGTSKSGLLLIEKIKIRQGKEIKDLAPGWDRTNDLSVNSRKLCLLSHRSCYECVFQDVFSGFYLSFQINISDVFALEMNSLIKSDTFGLIEDMVDDIDRLIPFVHQNIERYGGDTNKIHVMGHSAGAHIGMMHLATRPPTPDRPLLLRSFIGLSGPFDISDHFIYESKRGLEHVVGNQFHLSIVLVSNEAEIDRRWTKYIDVSTSSANSTTIDTSRIIICPEGIDPPSDMCISYNNGFYYCFLISVTGIIISILYKNYSHSEHVLSFSKVPLPLMQQTKSAIYTSFWASFYTSFYLFAGSLVYGFVILLLFRTFPLRIISFSLKFWFYSMALVFQHTIRQRLYEVHFTKNVRFTSNKLINATDNSNTTFLLFGLASTNPLIQHQAWRDFLYMSQYSVARRSQFFSDMNGLVETPNILQVVQEYEKLIRALIIKLECPPEHYAREAAACQPGPTEAALISMLRKTTGINLVFDLYEVEMRQSLSNTQALVWAIESLAAFILSAFPPHTPTRETQSNAQALHKYQIIQRFLAPLLELVALVDRLESRMSTTTTLGRSSIVKDPFYLKQLTQTFEVPMTCQGVLPTVRPHFRLIKYVGKNIISQLLDRVGNQLSEASFSYQYRTLFKEYRSGETLLYRLP